MRCVILKAGAFTTAALLSVVVPWVWTASAEAVPDARIDLNILVVDDGGAATSAITAELDSSGTPYTRVDLNQSGRPQISSAFLSDTVSGRARAKYQAVVLPNDNPFAAGSTEMAALATYEKNFGIRQVDAYTYARPDVGLNYAQNPGYIGSLDGTTGQVTTAGKAGPFGYLKGNVPFEDNAPDISESYGYLAVPLAQQQAGATFTSYVDAPIPGSTARGSLLGEYAHDGRRELVVNFVYNEYQQQFRLLARGIVDWMTQGIHLGANRNYLALHIDDVFAADDRWNSTLNCTPGDIDCTDTTAVPNPIRMTAADAQYAKQWSASHGLTFDMLFNGAGSEQYKTANGGTDPLATQLVADRAAYRWVNHTYEHPFLGCVQDTSAVPWKCATDAAGKTQYVPQSTITSQITQNRTWATGKGFALDNTELVTGEHSGMRVLPQQPDDNPNLAPALTSTGVKWLGSDNSRDPQQRPVGPSLTVPRYPMNVFYNVGRAAEQVDEYNWIYTRKADGGSGVCETAANSTCLPAPLSTATGYTSYIVPLESRLALGHVLANDPRPHYVHQSNLAEDRILYPVLDKLLADYAALFATSAPVVNLRIKDIGTELKQRAAWATAVKNNQVTAYRIGGTVTVTAPSGVNVTATMPNGTTQTQVLGSTTFGTAYAGERTGWVLPALLQSAVTLKLTTTATPAAPVNTPAAKIQAPAPELPVPAGVATPVPDGPGDTAAIAAADAAQN